jgi:hypothetical protein
VQIADRLLEGKRAGVEMIFIGMCHVNIYNVTPPLPNSFVKFSMPKNCRLLLLFNMLGCLGIFF